MSDDESAAGVGVQYAKGTARSVQRERGAGGRRPELGLDLVGRPSTIEAPMDASWSVLLPRRAGAASSSRDSRTGLRCSVVTVFIAVVAGVYGLVIGSFLNVVIWRVPRRESIVKPRSHCPACDTQIATRDNIPLVSWLVLRGPLPALREPDLDSVSVGGAVHRRAVRGGRCAVRALVGVAGVPRAHRALIAISAIDLEHFIIPNRIVYPVGYRQCGPARGRGAHRA